MKETFEYQGCVVTIDSDKNKIEIQDKKKRKAYTIFNDNNTPAMYNLLLNMKIMINKTKAEHNEGFFPQNPIAKGLNRFRK